MKKILMVGTIITMATAFTAQTVLADEFGSRFSGRAPAAFGDVVAANDGFDTENFDPSLIEPAAGDEIDAFSADTIENAPSNQSPEALISEIEKLITDIETNIGEK